MFGDLSIFPATTLQAVESRRRSFEAWGKASGSPLEEYLDRKNTMGGFEMAAEGRWTTWVLAPRDDPRTLDFMCSCESLRREVTVFRKSPNANSSSSKQAIGYGIASVYTPPNKRGKGYAAHMMRLLHWVLAPAFTAAFTFPEEWGLPPVVPPRFGNGVVSVLYTDIGPQFYKACGPVPDVDGWAVAPHIVTTWDVAATLAKLRSSTTSTGEADSEERQDDQDSEDGWTFLAKEKLKSYWDRDSKEIMKEPPPNIPSSTQTAFTFLPRKGLAEYLHRRIERIIDRQDLPPPHYGLWRSSDAPENTREAFASWTFELLPESPKTLLITRLRCPKDLLHGMLRKVAGYAEEYGFERIQVWNMPEELELEGHSAGGTSAPAEEHLSSVKWYGEEGASVEWLYNEKFAWC